MIVKPMTTSTVKYLGNLKTRATHTRSNEQYTTDAPPDNNGKGEFFSPTDIAATALANCAITIIGIKCANVGIDLGEINADVYKVMASNPRRIAEVKVDFYLQGDYTAREKEMIINAGTNCPVSKSLHPDLKQTFNFVWSEK